VQWARVGPFARAARPCFWLLLCLCATLRAPFTVRASVSGGLSGPTSSLLTSWLAGWLAGLAAWTAGNVAHIAPRPVARQWAARPGARR